MRVTLTDREGQVHDLEPTEGGQFAEAPEPCACGSRLVGGTGREVESHGTYRARGLCAGCREPRGVIRAQVETVFGLEEDERVLAGPWRVY